MTGPPKRKPKPKRKTKRDETLDLINRVWPDRHLAPDDDDQDNDDERPGPFDD